MDWNLANRSWYSHWEYFLVVRSNQNWFSTIESHIWPLDTFMKTQVKCEPLDRQKSNWPLDSLGNNHQKIGNFLSIFSIYVPMSCNIEKLVRNWLVIDISTTSPIFLVTFSLIDNQWLISYWPPPIWIHGSCVIGFLTINRFNHIITLIKIIFKWILICREV